MKDDLPMLVPTTPTRSVTKTDSSESDVAHMLTRQLLHILALHLCDAPCWLAHLRPNSFLDT